MPRGGRVDCIGCGKRVARPAFLAEGLCGRCRGRQGRERDAAVPAKPVPVPLGPCPHLPRSEGKLLFLMARAERREPLFQRDDARRAG